MYTPRANRGGKTTSNRAKRRTENAQREQEQREQTERSPSTRSLLELPTTEPERSAPPRRGPGSRRKEFKNDRQRARDAKLAGDAPLPSEEQHGYSVGQVSHAVDPYDDDETLDFLQHSPGTLFDVDPQRMRTMHHGISDRFASGKHIADTTQELREDPSKSKHLPAVTVRAIQSPIPKWLRKQEGGERSKTMLFAEDHRRVVAARNAGLSSVKAQFVSDQTTRGKFTTHNLGRSVDVRHYNQVGQGTHQREPKVTLPPGAKPYEWK